MLRLARACGFDEQAEICRVRDDAAFAGLDGVGEAFAGEDFAFENAEAAAVERERACVFQPQAAQGASRAAHSGPERNFFGFDFGLRDGDESGLIFLQRNFVFELVFEEVAEILAVCGCGHG